MLLPTTLKLHKCGWCLKPFRGAGDKSRHERIHTGEKPYVCTQCNRGFAQASALKTHYNVHSKAKPHACDICGRKFGDPSSRSRHKRERHGNIACYQCISPCKRSIKRKAEFVKHADKCETLRNRQPKVEFNVEDFAIYNSPAAPLSSELPLVPSLGPGMAKIEPMSPAALSAALSSESSSRHQSVLSASSSYGLLPAAFQPEESYHQGPVASSSALVRLPSGAKFEDEPYRQGHASSSTALIRMPSVAESEDESYYENRASYSPSVSGSPQQPFDYSVLVPDGYYRSPVPTWNYTYSRGGLTYHFADPVQRQNQTLLSRLQTNGMPSSSIPALPAPEELSAHSATLSHSDVPARWQPWCSDYLRQQPLPPSPYPYVYPAPASGVTTPSGSPDMLPGLVNFPVHRDREPIFYGRSMQPDPRYDGPPQHRSYDAPGYYDPRV